ncbi:cytoskeleton protein RodZ [Enhydrobacter aerosaccus]|uniref:Cytoskeleton protein RodZ n=1 Tax=Enhydrobacter aerosaccus TaxID=225324 RepID=A0A1T4T3K2_9HYPH|nr:helix-turn-helix domain-containing protein [Enhydrobacter aerosaccus]SKA35094.1 cytoskeleton protein RodZ [Enhydrobacter aerosaccus]
MPDQVDWQAMGHDTTGHAVGRLLRDEREARGLSIADVAKNLCIRPSYLEAIEQGRFEKLPGAAYVPAFLRAYARHLGLDAQKVLTAYQLSGSVPIERPVSMPGDFPQPERRAPIGLAVLTVLLVIAAGYGVWHYLPRQQPVVVEKVPPVPDRLLASQPSTSETARLATAPAVVTPGPAASKTDSQKSAAAPTAPAVQPQQPAQGPGLPRPPRQDVATAPPPPVAPPPAVIAVPAAPPPVMMSVPSAGQALAAQPPGADTPREAPADAATQEAVARPAPPANADTAVVVATPTKSDTKVVVRSNSWVELRSPNGDVLAQTYVRAGESYVVPAGISYRVIDAH